MHTLALPVKNNDGCPAKHCSLPTLLLPLSVHAQPLRPAVTKEYHSPSRKDLRWTSHDPFVTAVTDDAPADPKRPPTASRVVVSKAYQSPALKEQRRVSREAFVTAVTDDAPPTTQPPRSASRPAVARAYPNLAGQEGRRAPREALVRAVANDVRLPIRGPHSASRAADVQRPGLPVLEAPVAVQIRGTPTSETGESGAEHRDPDFWVLCMLVYLTAMAFSLIITVMYVIMSLEKGGPPQINEHTEDVDTSATSNASRPAMKLVQSNRSARHVVEASNYSVTLEVSAAHVGGVFSTDWKTGV
ncbi:hypothetical protein V5799_023277 [Amblyomma americanum]|uniref:Uncharacterized protein n=1 Tax=Amblyomma americanum TaxID=6943 RepID=A0AAQ4FHZ8_AMBAM